MEIDSNRIEIGDSSFARLFIQYAEECFHIRLFKNGMKRFIGTTNSHFAKHGRCVLFVKGIREMEGYYNQGMRNGMFYTYDLKGQPISIETYEEDVIQSRVITKGTKQYLDCTSNGSGLYGECCILNNEYKLDGRVLQLEETKEKNIFIYNNGSLESTLVDFRHEQNRSFMTVRNSNGTLVYVGEYQLDREKIEFSYNGYGMLFEYPNRVLMCVYKGEFKDNRFHGKGCMYDKNTRLKQYEGEYRDGKEVGGKSFYQGVEREMAVANMKALDEFPQNQYKLTFEERSFLGITQFDCFSRPSLQHIQEIEFKQQSFNDLLHLLITNHQTIRDISIFDGTFPNLLQMKILSLSQSVW